MIRYVYGVFFKYRTVNLRIVAVRLLNIVYSESHVIPLHYKVKKVCIEYGYQQG